MDIMASLAVLAGRQTQIANTETAIVNTAPAGALTLFVAGLDALRSGLDKDKRLRAIRDLRLRRMMIYLLGEIIAWEPTGGEALVIPYKYDRKKGRSRNGIPQMVGVHRSSFPFGDAMSSGAERVTVSIRALTKDDTPWRNALNSAKAGANRPMQAFLNELLEFYGAKPGVFYQAVISGGAGNVLTRGRRAANALARASKVLKPDELDRARVAQIAHCADQRVGYRTTAPLVFRCAVTEYEDYYHYGDSAGKYHAIWNIVLENGGQLKALLDVPVDKVFQVENVDTEYYARAQVTAAGATPAELNQVEATLRMICKEVERLHSWEPFGSSMLEALMASLPGSPQELRAPVFSIPDDEFRVMSGDGSAQGFFELVGAAPDEKDEGVSGNVAIGLAISPNHLDQHTITIDTDTYKVIAVIGETMSGKSVTAWKMAVQAAGRNIVFVHHSTTPDEFAGKLARGWSGTYLNPDLEIVHNEEEFRAAAERIREEINRKFMRWEREWVTAGYPLHLPLVIRVASGTEALAVFYKRFVRQEIIRLLTKFYEKYGWKFSLVDDDLADLPDLNVRDFDLVDIPSNEGAAMRHEITTAVLKLRKAGCRLYILTIQNQDKFELYGSGMFKTIPLALLISPGRHDVGAIARPKDMPPDAGFNFEEAAQAIVDGRGAQLPSWLIRPCLFNPRLPETILQQMGV